MILQKQHNQEFFNELLKNITWTQRRSSFIPRRGYPSEDQEGLISEVRRSMFISERSISEILVKKELV